MKTITINEAQQLVMAKALVTTHLEASKRLDATVKAAVGPPEPNQRWDKIPAQNIFRDVQEVCSAIDALQTILGVGSVAVAPNVGAFTSG
jgi:hypothetical protein